MANPWDNDVVAPSSNPWDKDVTPVPHGPGVGGMKPSTVSADKSPDPATLAPMGRFAGGVDQMLNLGGNRPDQKRQGLHNAFVGAAETAAPLALPALASAPVATVAAGLVGGAGKVLGTEIPKYLGVSPETSELIGDAASVPSAMFGNAGGEAATPALRALLARGVPSWASDLVGTFAPHAGFMTRGAGRVASALLRPKEATPGIVTPTTTGGYQRPDYSNLIRVPGEGVPPYESPAPKTPLQPGPQTDFGPHVPNYGNLIQSPEMGLPPSPSQPEAEVPHPRTYVSTRGAPELPWSVSQGRPSSGTTGGVVVQGKTQPYVGPTSFNAAPKVTPGAIPELMRQQRLQSGDAPAPVILDPSGRPIAAEPPTFANGGIKNNTRRR